MIPSPHRTPGQLIQELLDARGWTQRVLAIVLKTSETGINKIIAGKQPVDAAMALALSELFDVEAERFLELQKNYELAQARIITREDPDRKNRAHLFQSFPVPEMIKRGWIEVEDIRNYEKVEAEFAKFFKAKTVSEIEIFPHAAKKTNVSEKTTPTQLAWLYRAKEIAAEMLVAKYSPSAVSSAIPKLEELLISADSIRKVPRILAESGIRYAIVEALPGSRIDGVCFWLNEAAPVITMSLLHDRIDNFWFVLRHELEHVLRRDGQTTITLDTDLEGAADGAALAEDERIANEAAAEFCVSQKALNNFISRKKPFFYERDVVAFAKTLGVHPGLVAGQLRRKLNAYNRFHNHLTKVRSIVSPSATVDGWGDVVPVG